MSEQLYVTKEEGKNLSFNYSYKQTFFREPKRNHGMPEYVIVLDFMNSDDVSKQVGREILSYLRKFYFATEDMLSEMLESKELDTSILSSLLETYVDKCLVNYFTISKYSMDMVPDDAMKIYCLDTGGIYILEHFAQADRVSWLSSDNIRSVELVTKYLATGMFANALVKNKGKSVNTFDPIFDANIGKRIMRFSADFRIMNGYTPLEFVLEVVRDFDIPGPWTKKCGEQISVFSGNRCWQRYFSMEPGYVLLCENEEVALEAAKILARGLSNQEIRLITDRYFSGDPNSIFAFDQGKQLLLPVQDKAFLAE